MNTLEIQRTMIEEIEEVLEYDLDFKAHRVKFLCNLIGIPLCSVIGNDDRLIEEITNWIKN